MGNYTSQQRGGAFPTDKEKKTLLEQWTKYNTYLEKDPNNDAYHVLRQDLDDLRTKIFNDSDNIDDLLQDFLDIFSGLEENNFKIGQSKYPGPGEPFKALIAKYIGD